MINIGAQCENKTLGLTYQTMHGSTECHNIQPRQRSGEPGSGHSTPLRGLALQQGTLAATADGHSSISRLLWHSV